MKTCTACGESKELDGFPPDLRTRDGHGALCLTCSRQYQMQHRENVVSIQGDPARRAPSPPSSEEPRIEGTEGEDELGFVEPAIAHWRAELAARRQAGIPDEDVDLQQPVEESRSRARPVPIPVPLPVPVPVPISVSST